jgi:hypothetical protein
MAQETSSFAITLPYPGEYAASGIDVAVRLLVERFEPLRRVLAYALA